MLKITNHRRSVASWILIICLLVSLAHTDVRAETVLPLDAAVTKSNVMSLARTYDTDGAYLLHPDKKASDYMTWLYGSRRITDNLNTAVHEMTHDYTFSHAGSYKAEAIYLGNKKKIIVPFTKIYYTKKMAKSIPKRCRTMRYNTYVANPTPYLSSNTEGVYGLLNEFSAYSWGMNNTICLFDYYKNFPLEMNTWHNFINAGANDRLAYAEFKYYILHYIYYAKKHYPKIYKKIMNNKKFRKAYRKTEKRFAGLIKKYKKDLDQIKKMAAANKINAGLQGGYFFINGSGTGVFADEYDVLIKEISKKKYQKIHRKLLK